MKNFNIGDKLIGEAPLYTKFTLVEKIEISTRRKIERNTGLVTPDSFAFNHDFLYGKSSNIFLDDERTPQENKEYLLTANGFGDLYNTEKWLVIKSFDKFKEVIEWIGLPKRISFDHDLGELKGKVLPNGYDCCKWLVDYCLDNNLELTTECKFHTANPVGRLNMETLINNYKRCTK